MTSTMRKNVASLGWGSGGSTSTSIGYVPGFPENGGHGLATRCTYARTCMANRSQRARKLWTSGSVRPVTRVAIQLNATTEMKTQNQTYSQISWGTTSRSRKKTVRRERRRSSVTTSRTG